MMRHRIAFFFSIFLFPIVLSAQAPANLLLSADRIRIDESIEGGFLLTIKSGGIGSLLITESTKNTNQEGPVYTFYTSSYNGVNGNERRVLNGQVLNAPSRFFLVDSTPEYDSTFQENVFRIFIPNLVQYGYSGIRSGEISIGDGTFINIRAFELPYADYSGAFLDNPFIVRIVQTSKDNSDRSGVISKLAELKLQEIANLNQGLSVRAESPGDVGETIQQIIDNSRDSSLDLLLVLDTTRSMKNDIAQLSLLLPDIISPHFVNTNTLTDFQLGIVYYRDYNEKYIATNAKIIDDSDGLLQEFRNIEIEGGGDEPEAVYESLYVALQSFDWKHDNRNIVLIGDAPPHPLPRGEVTLEVVQNVALQNRVQINTVILPK